MKFNKWKQWMIWTSIDFDWKYWNQCVDLIRDYTTNVFWKNYPTSWNAKDLWNKNWWQDYTKYPNTITFIPKVWDIVIWWNGKYWHIAVVTAANILSFVAIEQNAWTGNGDGMWQNAIREHRYYYRNILWFIRHKSIEDDIIDLKDLYGWKYWSLSLPVKKNWIPIKYRKKSSRTLWLARVKWLHPSFKKNEIYIYENQFIKYWNNKDRLEKILEHEYTHFVYHLWLDKKQKRFWISEFNKKDQKYFVSKYAKTHPAEDFSEIIWWYKIYVEKWIKLPTTKYWDKIMQEDYEVMVKPLYETWLIDLKILIK